MSEMAQNEQDTTESGSAPLATYEGWGANRLPNQVGDPLVLVAPVLRTFLPCNALLAALWAFGRWNPRAWGFAAFRVGTN